MKTNTTLTNQKNKTIITIKITIKITIIIKKIPVGHRGKPVEGVIMRVKRENERKGGEMSSGEEEKFQLESENEKSVCWEGKGKGR